MSSKCKIIVDKKRCTNDLHTDNFCIDKPHKIDLKYLKYHNICDDCIAKGATNNIYDKCGNETCVDFDLDHVHVMWTPNGYRCGKCEPLLCILQNTVGCRDASLGPEMFDTLYEQWLNTDQTSPFTKYYWDYYHNRRDEQLHAKHVSSPFWGLYSHALRQQKSGLNWACVTMGPIPAYGGPSSSSDWLSSSKSNSKRKGNRRSKQPSE